MQLVEQPVQRFGEYGQPAVVLDQFQAGGQGFQCFFLLRANKKFRVYGFAGARCNRVQWRDHADGIQVGVHLALEQVALDAITQNPGGGKVMLDHRDITIGRRFFNIDLVVFDVLEFNLLVLLGVGVNRRAGEG